MDYQAGIVARVPQPDQLLQRARTAIDLVRDWGGQIGYVRVALEDEDFDVPESSRMGARVLVLAEGCAGTDPEVHAFLLETIFPRRAELITLPELPALLSRG